MDPDGGPQAERSRRLETQNQVQAQIKPLVPTPAATLPSVSTCVAGCCVESEKLADERNFLKRYAERLLIQLRELLQRYGELEKLKTLADAAPHEDEKHNPLAPWLTAPEYTNPLFHAYDLKIQELESALMDTKKAMDRVATRAESQAKENTALKQELEIAGEKMVLRMQNEPREMHVMNDDLMQMQESGEYLQAINERIDVLMQENNMLMEQVSLQDDEINDMKRELTDRDEQLQVMGQNFNDATIALQELRDACAQLKQDKKHCEVQLQRYAASIAELESAKESLLDQTEFADKERRNLETQLREYEEMLETRKKSGERKDEAFSTRYQNVCVRLRELTSALEAKDRAVDELQDQNNGLQSELEAVRQDCEGMLNVLNSMEKQLTQYCAREDAVAELESECKAKVEETILEKEQVVAREVQSRREIACLFERLKQQAVDFTKTQEESLHTVVRKHESDMRSREEEIKALTDELATLRPKLELAARNQKETDKKLADATRRSKDATVAFEKKLLNLTERAAAAEEARDMSCQQEVEYVERIRSKEDELTKLRAELRDRVQELNQRVSTLERELEIRRTETREAKDESEEQHRKVQLLNDQLHKVKADCANRFTAEFDVLHQQNRELKAHIAELEYKVAQAKKEAALALDNAHSERERTEVRLIAEVESLKGRIQSLKDERKRVDKSRQETDAKCSVLSLQVQQLRCEVSDTKELLMEQERACDDSDRKVSELSAQLNAALSRQQQFYRQERELRTAVERMTLERTRMEREATMARKKIDAFRSNSYAFPSYLHSQMQSESTDHKHSGVSTRDGVLAEKFLPAKKAEVRSYTPVSFNQTSEIL